MEKVTLVIALAALAVAAILFIGNIWNNGIASAFSMNSRAKKYAVVSLIIYAASISCFVLLRNI
ncbi:hypothetical protein BBD41_11865 [Paenibacillus ihbetae]|uniref:Uncharacterized protein n=1 Tax=Paenibacillus ihbetae TaxID=1870820 RepID=A0A1B2DZT2_9BACL|nr:hypothetical protein [Paenibacillus ihbetae]ANY73225.1 hypothetical protein BBD41_11865 [Paenibacillus ihbetae]